MGNGMGNGISVFMPEVYRTVRIAGQEGAVGVKGQTNDVLGFHLCLQDNNDNE